MSIPKSSHATLRSRHAIALEDLGINPYWSGAGMSGSDLRTLAMIGLSLPQIARALSLSQCSVRSLLRRRGLYASWKSKRAYLRRVRL